MNQIALKDFRCFGDQQTARLAPLTLLVGENSTGKTSLLAMIRALLDVVVDNRVPDFKEEPYDLGSFEEVVNHRGSRVNGDSAFEAGFQATVSRKRTTKPTTTFKFNVIFERLGTIPFPVIRTVSSSDNWFEIRQDSERRDTVRFGTRRGVWEWHFPGSRERRFEREALLSASLAFVRIRNTMEIDDGTISVRRQSQSPPITAQDISQIQGLAFASRRIMGRVFASAPVRSKPRRTYDPSRPIRDPEGDYVPMYLANIYSQNKEMWMAIKSKLEAFGKASGLFDEISIKRLGKKGSEPFQLQVRKFYKGRKGPQRNLIDVGYGVSQVLPVITEMLRQDAPDVFLLQQPEVHLHPKAQAALGSLFCEVASQGRELIVETHSDYILDRVRMDIRDGKTSLKPEDVSILFFERQDLGVEIHSIRLDDEGNVLDAPPGYGNFFINETTRSLGL